MKIGGGTTPSAVKAVLRLVAAWGGSNADGAALLGVSESSWDRMKAGMGRHTQPGSIDPGLSADWHIQRHSLAVCQLHGGSLAAPAQSRSYL